MDTATEGLIRQRMAEKLPGLTRIIIAQRISSVCHAYQIFILEDGHLAGCGTHQQLLAENTIIPSLDDITDIKVEKIMDQVRDMLEGSDLSQKVNVIEQKLIEED